MVMGYVYHTIINGGTPLRRIRDCVNLCVNSRLFMSIPYNRLVVSTCKETIVTHTDESVILDKDTTNLESLTWRADGCEFGSLHEVVVPGNSVGHI